jgi:hypothetical protein
MKTKRLSFKGEKMMNQNALTIDQQNAIRELFTWQDSQIQNISHQFVDRYQAIMTDATGALSQRTPTRTRAELTGQRGRTGREKIDTTQSGRVRRGSLIPLIASFAEEKGKGNRFDWRQVQAALGGEKVSRGTVFNNLKAAAKQGLLRKSGSEYYWTGHSV